MRVAKAGHSLFITGSIGTGKTKTLQTIVSEMRSQKLRIAVTASTGLASKQIKGRDFCKNNAIYKDFFL